MSTNNFSVAGYSVPRLAKQIDKRRENVISLAEYSRDLFHASMYVGWNDVTVYVHDMIAILWV